MSSVIVDRTADYIDILSQHQCRYHRSNSHLPSTFRDQAVQMAGLLIEKERLVRQQRSAYVAISSYSMGPSMTEFEREQLDYDMTSFAKGFDQNLILLRSLISSSPKSSVDCKKHYELIVLYLYTKLQALMEQIREMRLYRSQRLKLRPSAAAAKASNLYSKISSSSSPSSSLRASALSLDSNGTALIQEERQRSSSADGNRMADLHVSSEQMMVLEHENAALFAELDSDMNAVRQAEAKLNEIAELFSLFSTKIVEQQQQIETIYDNIVTGKSNIDMALDQLRKYLKSSVSFRLNILTIFVIAGLSLLFLDWFQD